MIHQLLFTYSHYVPSVHPQTPDMTHTRCASCWDIVSQLEPRPLYVLYTVILGLPWWFRQKRIRLQCGRDLGSVSGLGRSSGGRAWQPTPVFLPEESPWAESLEGYSPWGCKELDMFEQLSTAHRIPYSYFSLEVWDWSGPVPLFLCMSTHTHTHSLSHLF